MCSVLEPELEEDKCFPQNDYIIFLYYSPLGNTK